MKDGMKYGMKDGYNYPHSSAGNSGTRRGEKGYTKKMPTHGSDHKGHMVKKSSGGPSVYCGTMSMIRDPNVPHQNEKCG